MKKRILLLSMILLTCGTVIHAESSVEQELDALVAAKNLNGLVRVFEEAIGKDLDDKRARSCTTIMRHIKNESLPKSFKAELLTLLVRFGGAESVEGLADMLDDEDPALSTRAVLGLQRNPSERAAVALRKALTDASAPKHQAVFIHALIERGDAASLPQFIKLAESKDTAVRNLALRGVSLMSDEPLNALFQAGMKQDSKTAAIAAANAYLAHAERLAESGKKKEAIAIYRELVALGRYQKGNALMGLATVGGMEELDAILQGLKGADQRDLAAVLDHLFLKNGDEKQDITKLYRSAGETNAHLKPGLLRVLGIYADPASLDTVLSAVGDSDDRVRRAALAALGHFDHERATDALIAAVVSGEDRNIAVQALEESPGRTKIAEKLKKALPNRSGPARLSLIRLLGNCPKAECVPVLLETLKDADSRVRAEALDALAKAGAPSTYAPVVELLAGEPDREVRSRAMAALSALGKCGVAPAERSRLVLGRLRKGDCPGRAELIAMLPKVTSGASRTAELKILGEALESKDQEIRRAGFRAMEEWPDPDAVLEALLSTAAKEPGSVNSILALRAYTKQLERLSEKHAASIRRGRVTNPGKYVDGGNINLSTSRDGGEVTVSMWVRPTALSGDNRLYGQLSGTASQQGTVRVTSDGRMEVWNGATWLRVAPAGALTTGNWHHLAFVWKGNSVRAYVNGVAGLTATANFEFGAANGHFGIAAPFLGRYGTAFVGGVDEVAIFAVALNPGQIKILANGSRARATVPKTLPAPAHYWRFDENGGIKTSPDLRPNQQGAAEDMVQRYRKALNVAVTRPEKCALLNGLGGQRHVDALKAALDRIGDPDVREEAMLAAYTISAALGKSRAQAVRPALKKIIANTASKTLKKSASDLLKSLPSDGGGADTSRATDIAPAKPPANAIVLFDGTDTSAWMQHGSMRIPSEDEVKKAPRCHYKLVDGALEVNDPGHVVTKQHFNDFRLHVEVWLPGEDGINSGIWTHFRYCNEIRGRGEKGPKYRLGAIYGLKAPDVDASRPARTWQALDITFRNARFDRRGKKTENARITVLLNGVKIHDDVEIKSRCPTLMEPEGPSPGPIVLENHGSRGRVRFRNIWIVPR